MTRKVKIVHVAPSFLKVDHKPVNFVVLFDASPDEARRAARAVAPYGFVGIFETRTIDKISDFSKVKSTQIMQPVYIGNLDAASKRKFIKQWCDMFINELTTDFTSKETA